MSRWVALAAALGVPALGAGSGHDWPRVLGPRGDGRSAETGLALDWPESGPPLLWQTEVGDGYAPPVVAAGRAFVFDRTGGEARLRALDADTGRLLWESRYATDYADYYGYSPGPRSAPVVDGERVYAFGAEGRLRCHDVRDGSVVWEVDTAERFGVVRNFFGVGASPVVEGELLITPVGGSPPGSPEIHSGAVRGNGTGLVAFDKQSGEVRWTATDELAAYSSPVVAELGGERLGVALLRGGLVVFEPGTGSVRSRFPWRAATLESVNAANPVVVGDRVLIAECYGPGGVLLRYGGGGLEAVWKDPPRDRSLALHWMTPIVEDGVIYASSGRGAGEAELRAVDLETGKVLWAEPGLGRATMILADGHLIVLTEHGRLLAVRPRAQRLVVVADATPRLPDRPEMLLLDPPAWAPPALAHGRLYLRGRSRVACLDLRSRQPAEAKGKT
jgi:outer membrane protein assembly factor BamB